MIDNRPLNFVYLFSFFLPLYSLSFDLLVQISWYKIFPIFLILIAFLQGWSLRINRPIFKVVACLFFYMVFVTYLNYFYFVYNGAFEYAVSIGQDSVRAYLHMIIQLVTIVLTLSPLFYFRAIVRNESAVDSFMNGYVDGNLFSGAVGIVMYLLFKMERIGIESIYYDYASGLFRLSGLGGEPKQFAAFALLAFFVIVVNRFTGRELNINFSRTKGLLLLVFIILSFSTSVWIGLIIGFVVVVGSNVKVPRSWYIVVLTVSILVIALFYDSVGPLFKVRFIDRIHSLDSLFIFAPKDGLAYFWLKSEPFLAVFGSGAGGLHYRVMNSEFILGISSPFVRASIIQVVFNGTAATSMSPSSFIIKYIVEYGVVGYSLLLAIVLYVIKQVKGSRYRKFVSTLGLIVLFSVTVSIMYTCVYIAILGVIYGCHVNDCKKMVLR